jgi:hypothetical protein
MELAATLHVAFQRDADNLGSVEYTWIASKAIGPVLLERHEHPMAGGTDVVVDSRVSREKALKALKTEFKVSHDTIEWITECGTYEESIRSATRATAEARKARGA